MVVVNVTAGNCQPQTIVIGRRGTYDTMQIAFDLSNLIEAYGNGVAVLAVKRSQDESAYPAVTTQEDNTLTWTVSETDTAYVGAGECQLMWYVDGGLAKTIIYPMVVMRDILATSEDAPDAYQTWVDDLTALGAETLQNAQDAAQSASDAEQAKDDAVAAKEAAEEAASMLQNVSAAATTLEPNQPATANYNDGVFSFGIPKGDKGDKMTYADLTEADKLDLIQGPIAEAQADAEQAVEDKGQEVLDSLPQDYTELVDEVSDLSNAISEGNLNQHIKVNPFVIGTGFISLPVGELRPNRSVAEILENGGAKFTRNEDSSTSPTFGCFVRIRANDGPSNSGHKLYIRLADVDVSNMSNYDRMIISGSNGTDGSRVGIPPTNLSLTNNAAEIIVTPDSDFEVLNIFAHSSTPASEGEYFTIGSAQYIDLTDMFGAGYEPPLEIFKSVYESGMPYLFSVPTITSDLKDVIALIKNIPDCDIVQTSADIAATTKDYVLVMDNDSRFAQGGPLLYKKMAVASAGYLRDDGSRVCAVPDQGVLEASNPPKDLLMGLIKSYIDNPALSYEHDVDLFSETPNGKINCSAFVSAVLQGISYNSSKYVLSDNLSMDKVINAGFSKTNQLIKLSSFNMAEYFAENKRLFSLKCLENGYESRRKLQFGDILFFTDTQYPDRYYGIGHVAIVIDASWDYCTIAHVTSQAAGGIVQQNFGTETGCCTLLRLTATQADNTFKVFARPDYNEPKLRTAIQVLKSCLDGNYEINLGHDYTPGYSLNQTTMLPSMSVSYGISGYYDAIGGATVKYIGAATDASGNGYVCLLAQYDENYAPIIRSSITTNPVVLNSATRYIRLQFGYTLSSGVIPTLHTGDDCTVVMYMHPGNVYDDITDLSNAISQKQDATNYVTLSGTIVTQTGADNTMYLCGELAELTFTAPATGQTAIRFSSGTTPTVATFSGVTWLNGFDPSAIEASKTYEVNILNGLGVAAWT